VIGLSRRVRVFAYTRPVDMRKQYDGLYALVVSELKADPLSGDLFLFTNRRRTRAKVLLWDGTGLCIYQKRLERGRFALLWRRDTLRIVMATRRTRSVRTHAERACALPRRQYVGRCLTALPADDLPASSDTVPPRGAALLNLATETDIERLRQAALLLEQENARLFRRLETLVAELREARGEDARSLQLVR
jgi:transposase